MKKDSASDSPLFRSSKQTFLCNFSAQDLFLIAGGSPLCSRSFEVSLKGSTRASERASSRFKVPLLGSLNFHFAELRLRAFDEVVCIFGYSLGAPRFPLHFVKTSTSPPGKINQCKEEPKTTTGDDLAARVGAGKMQIYFNYYRSRLRAATACHDILDPPKTFSTESEILSLICGFHVC